ncbi:thiol:disulfide interchange protein DsbA/DsbL [Lysobacter sp. CFH 32150]|uniref:thiol:disulfide interchange protein DsbA/DsbL n=1 Tax=Lysobacter sp. CFH 32150 TaxID=2927128 RepID=UPI001FA7DFD2|nr:thiol:disulfide interchange protein DsbA/DsbL [Lysobacter sp. CFH 32150]MCI4569390.1 thiol:disulfide interchange protein DsbA/DsbL [Lysobacter sp. CFH 32150]
MTKRLALPLLALLLMAACTAQNEPVPAAAPASDAPAAAEAPSADAPAVTAPAEDAPATEPAAEPAATEQAASEPAPAAPVATTPPSGLVPGVDYVEIKGGQPYRPLEGKVEVVEVFGYVCPACAAFHPVVSAWEAKLPADVRFTYVPAPFGPEWIPYAKAFYVAESLGLVGKSHDAVIRAIHVQQSLPGEGDKPDEAAIAKFYAQYGADPKSFLSTMNSFAIDAKINRGKQFMIRSGVGSTPTIVVNGKYRVEGKGWEDKLRIADALVAQERAARQ